MSYQDVKDRLYRGHRKIANNTYLELVEKNGGEELISMRLHGHTVAVFYQDHLELFSAGWHTVTTKNRLNLALLIGLWSYTSNIILNPGYIPQIYQANYQWYYGITFPYQKTDPKFYDGMKIGYDGRIIQ